MSKFGVIELLLSRMSAFLTLLGESRVVLKRGWQIFRLKLTHLLINSGGEEGVLYVLCAVCCVLCAVCCVQMQIG
jgi:hypothetical protein